MKALLTIPFALLMLVHEYYISVCDIEYNDDEQALEIAIKVTTHDLEHALGIAHLGTKKESEAANEMIFSYLKKHFTVTCDGQLGNLDWVGKEVKLEDMWIYVQVSEVAPFEHLSITNSILCREFEEQQNHINVKVPGHEDQGTILSGDNTSHEFHFHK